MKELESEKVNCEVCHEPFDPTKWGEMLREYEDEIYRPGEELPDNLTEEEWDEREIEIRKLFEQPESDQ